MASIVIVCLGYVVGLLLTAWSEPLIGIPLGIWVLTGLSVLCVWAMPRWWRMGPRSRMWAIASIVALLAFGYLQWRSPTPGNQDISAWVNRDEPVEVRGEIIDEPRLTRSQSVRFWLAVEDCRIDEPGEPPTIATGKLYVTLPLLQGTGLEPNQRVAIAGELYRPRPADSPGEFDFQKYLARHGSFAGLRGETVTVIQRDRPLSAMGWGLRQIQNGLRSLRQRVIRAQVEGLGSGGLLVSSMVLGRRAVDLPYDIYDRFVQAGMAHTLAASGFHVTLLLGLALGLTAGRNEQQQGAIALGTLMLYVGLTGLHPSVARASFMGAAAVLGLVMQRRVNALRSLLVAAVILLILNPLWIWDLGFQFSFLATFGLLATAEPLTQRLDWMPPNIASLIAIPLAAFIWTVPIQLFSFGVMPLYSIGANVLLTPLVWFISIGGMVTGAIALCSPLLGSYTATVLHLPVELLLHSVSRFTQLPGHSYAVGAVSIAQVLLVYGVLLTIWQSPRWRSRWWIGGLVAIALIIVPTVYRQTMHIQLAALPTREPVLVWQHHGDIGLINAGTDTDVQYTVLPFLQQQGINHIDWAIALSPIPSFNSGWYRLLAAMPIGQLYGTEAALPLLDGRSPPPQTILANASFQVGQIQLTVQPLSNVNQLTTVQFLDQTWLLLDADDDLSPDVSLPELPTADMVWWSDRPPSLSFLEDTQPTAVLSSSKVLPTSIQNWLTQQGGSRYSLSENGAVVWQPSGLRVTQSRDAE
jgi:competence protein ComEC